MLISFDAISFKRAYIFMNSTYTHTYLRMRNIYALRSHINITKRLCICMYPIKKAWLFDIFPIQMSQGPCTNHVDRIVGNFDLPPLYRNFYLIAVIKCCGNLSNPPPPSFVNSPFRRRTHQVVFIKDDINQGQGVQRKQTFVDLEEGSGGVR